MNNSAWQYAAELRKEQGASGGAGGAGGRTWRRGADQQGGASPAVPAGYIRFRDQLAEIGGALTFRVPALTEDAPIRLQIRSGCLGDAAMSGRHAVGSGPVWDESSARR